MGAYKTEQGKYTIDWILLHLPVFGKMLQMSILARFSRSLGNLLNSGIPIIQSLNINAKGLGNAVYRQRVELAAEDVSHGIGLAESLRDLSEFPDDDGADDFRRRANCPAGYDYAENRRIL